MAAVIAAAHRQAAQHPAFIPDSDLPEFDPNLEDRHQVFHQLPEIHPDIRRKKEDDLRFAEQEVCCNQLHVQIALGDLLAADSHRLIFLAAQLLVAGQIAWGCQAVDPLHIGIVQGNDLRLDRGNTPFAGEALVLIRPVVVDDLIASCKLFGDFDFIP